jgi:EAL domain-containing protein (putative c-di-GMP-specific phosphodiesterase class I)/GGDEF domain-containing protein
MGTNGTNVNLAMRRTDSVAARVIMFVTCVALAIGVVAVFLILGAVRHKAQSQAASQALEVIEAFRPIAAQALAEGDLRSLDAAAKALAASPLVISITVYDLQHRPLTHAGKTPLPEGPPVWVPTGSAALVTVGEAGANSRVMIAHEGTTVGMISFVFNSRSFFSPNVLSFLPIILILLATVGLAVPLAQMFANRLVSPLQELLRVAQEVSGQRLNARAEITTRDEFSVLGDAMNDMIGRMDAAMRRVQELAFMDPLTALPNQERFIRDVRDMVSRGADTPLSAIVIVNMDRLPKIVDALGEEAGQELIVQASERLQAAVAHVDKLVRTEICVEHPTQVARLKPTEFGLLVPLFTHSSEAARFGQMLVSALNQPFDWREHKLTLGAGFGVAIAPHDGTDADTLMRNAHLAASAARGSQPSLRFFTRSLDKQALEQLSMERELRAGIEQNQFRAYFQPKVDLKTGEIFGAEALARWIRPDGPQIGPARFIPAAEELGLVGQISDAVMRDAAWKAAAWAREGTAIQVAVNVSPLQFRDDRFGQRMLKLLEQAGLPAFCLELEITESIAMEDPARALRLIQPLRERGVRIAIDDFGCGHSSLAALTRLPFDVLKIDRGFVQGLPTDRSGCAIVETIITMSRALDFEVVAEGIETVEQADFLRQAGATYGQGFLFGAATPPAEFIQQIRRGSITAA